MMGLEVLEGTAHAADALGISGVVNTFVLSIRIIGGAVFLGACVWAGIRALMRHGLEAIFEVLIGLAVAAGLIVGAPTIAAAAIGTAPGASVGPVPPWLWNEVVDATLTLGAVIGVQLTYGMRLYLGLRRRLCGS